MPLVLFSFFRRKTAGFSLTELAIVLAVVGVILAALWGAAGAIRQSQRVSQTIQQIIQICEGIRATYRLSAIIKETDSDSFTKSLIGLRIVPKEMIVDASVPSLVSLWGGSFTIGLDTGTGLVFALVFQDVPKESCVELLTRVAGDVRDPGLQHFVVGPGGGTATAPPVGGLAAASDFCKGDVNYMQFAYRLRS